MEELQKIYKKEGSDFINDLLSDYVIVTEKLSGSSFAFEKHGDELQFFKGNGHKPISLVDRTMMMYYEPPIRHITQAMESAGPAVPDNWRFCFQYFVHNEPGVIKYTMLPKNNLVLTHIHVKGENGKTAKIIDDPRVIADWARELNVTPLKPFFVGHLDGEQREKIKEFITVPVEDQEELFGTESFAEYIMQVLNPGVTATTLHGDLKSPIDSLVFKFVKPGSGRSVSAKIIDPYTRTLMKQKEPVDLRRAPADMNEIVLLDLLAFIEERGIKQSDAMSGQPEERYVELVSGLFNDYVAQHGDELEGVRFDKADFATGPEFDLNLDMIQNAKTKELVSGSSGLADLYKVMLGSLRKKRDESRVGSVMTPSVVRDFNKMIDKIDSIVNKQDGGEFKTFEEYLKMKQVNESFEDPIESISEELVLNFSHFANLERVDLNEALNVPYKERGKQKVNMIVGRFQPFTLGHAKVFKQIHDQNGLPVVVFTVRGKKPNPEKSPFSEETQQAMFAKMQKEYPFLEAMYVAPSAGIDTLYSMMRPAYEPVLWGFGTDRKKAYEYMINKPEYREQLDVDPDFKGYEIKRADEDISASKVRQAIKLDDEKTFKRMTPKSIHDMYIVLQDVLTPIEEGFINESKSDYSVESTNPGTLHKNPYLNNELEKSKKMDLYKTFAKNIPKGIITDHFIKYINRLNQSQTQELVSYLGSVSNIRNLDPKVLYGNRSSVIGMLFDLSARGTGKGELAVAWLVNGAEIQGGNESYDVAFKGNKYEVKDWSTQGNTAILTGVKSKVTNFEFWIEIVDTLRRLDKLTGRSAGSSKFNLMMYFSPEFVSVVNRLLDEQAMILSGEVSKERLELLNNFYEQASKLKSDVQGYSNLILRGPNSKPLEMSIMPISPDDAASGQFTVTVAEKDESLTYILSELRRLKYVRDPKAFQQDMQAAVDQVTKGITYIVFRKGKINFVEPGGFKPDVISISSLKFIEKDL